MKKILFKLIVIINKLFPKRYILDKNNLEYKHFIYSPVRFLLYLFLTIILGLSVYILIAVKFTTPKEKKLKEEYNDLYSNLSIMNNRLNYLTGILNIIESNDSVVYRSVFETDPYYRNYNNKVILKYDSLSKLNTEYQIELTFKKILRFERRLTDEYKDFQKLTVLAKQKRDFLESVPSIQPISNKDLKRTASGYGYRIDPIYKTRSFHFGLDFASPLGTIIYATGKGKVLLAGEDDGYGNAIIIDHGYKYKTLYGHLSKIIVKNGQEVKRGQIIGYVGSTGMSTGAHLHYEVIFNDKKINPVGFFFNDLTISEYDQMIKISSDMSKTFD